MNVLVTHGFEANYTLGFAKGLASNGVPLCVFSSSDTEQRLKAAGITNLRMREQPSEDASPLRKGFMLIRYYLRILAFLTRNRIGTIHFTGIFRNELILFEGVILNLGFRLFSQNYVYTAHNVLPHNRGGSPFFRKIYRFIYRIPNVILVHTEKGRVRLIEEFGVPDYKIRVKSIGLNEEIPITSLNRKEARARLGYPDEAKIILFFGRIDEYKGLHLLLDAFGGLDVRSSRLLIAGSFRSAAYGALITSKISESRRKSDIRLDQRLIPNEEVEMLFKGADVLCLPYLQISQSGLLFLAARFGTPTVSTNVGSMAEFVSPECGLVSKTTDSDGIKAALEQFFADSGRFERERIREAGNRFRWDRICYDLVPLYEQRGPSGNS